ncbi:TPA: hypothetical protein ACGD5E_000320 [Serratia marcescens]
MDKLHEESRKQFEGWVKNQYSCKGNTLLRVGPNKERYHQVVIQECWEAWQSSRASIVIDLPKGITTREALDLGYMGDYAAGVDDGIEESAKVIRSIGLSIKGE